MVNIGIIGHGYWGPNLLRNFTATPDCRVLAVCDTDATRLLPLQSSHPGLVTTTNPQDLITHPALHAIAIATPVASHYSLAMQALTAGKHVFVEKPLAASTKQAETLVNKARQTGLCVQVDHTFIYTGAVRKIKELITGDELGPLYYYDSVRVNLGLFQSDVSVLWDLAVHDLSILDYILNEPPYAVSVTGQRHIDGSPENIAFITLLYPGNFIAHLHVNWLAPVKLRRTLIGGSRKMIVYDDLEPSEKIKVYDKGITLNGHPVTKHRAMFDYRTGDMWAPRIDTTEALKLQTLKFINSIQTGEPSPSDGESGVRVVRILEAAERSLQERGRPVRMDRPFKASVPV
ncbi:MAG: Gfo/Idh/MocA family protein [Methylococcaceae bacterium]